MNVYKNSKSIIQSSLFLAKCSPISTRSITQTIDNRTHNLRKVVQEAETIVGYPTSFLNLRWLLNDEAANIAFFIKRLIGTDHPLLETAKDLIMGNTKSTWGLVVLLISKAAGVNSVFTDIEHDHVVGILHSQRVLAEVTEMIRISNVLHKGVININPDTKHTSDMNFGNTVALLSGDYLLSTCFHELACLKNHDLNEMISSSLRDLAEAEFIGPRSIQNEPLPCEPVRDSKYVPIPNEFGTSPLAVADVLGNSKSEWMLRSILGGASLLAKSCKGCLLLAGHSQELQNIGYIFGRNLALAWQASLECQQFQSKRNKKLSLISAPIMFHLQHDPEFYSEFQKLVNTNSSVDYSRIRDIVCSGPGLEKTHELKLELSSQCLEALCNFQESRAKDALIKLIKSL